jgi:Bacterial regulatory protein, Fis family
MASAVAQLATSKGGGHRQHSIEEYAEALRAAKGMVSQAARILDVSQQAVRQRLAKSPLLRQTVADARDAMTDAAELTLYNRIVAGDAWAVCFYLKT